MILSTRALDPVYNPSVVLEAFGLLRRRVPGAQLVLKHPGASLPPAIEARVTDLGLQEATHVIGFVDDETLAGLYCAADAFLSIPSSDSSPRSVWEALACGTPAVVSDLPWVRDVLRDGEHALLVPVDAEAVAAALERVISEPGTATAIAQGGLALTRATMSRSDHLARLKTLYDGVLA